MPTYLYECEKCGQFEELQKITADPLEECPDCGSDVKRLIGSPGIIFKGSGFYINKSGSKANGKKGSDNSTGNSKEKVS